MATVLALDGVQELVGFREDDCCPPDICEIDVCVLMCNFIQLLPDGPLWDRAKMQGMDKYRQDGCNGITCAPPEDVCTSLVNYAAYAGRVLHNLLFTALWPALREADPRTAWLTLDDWLDRLGWQDCYASACRDPGLGALAPFEIEGDCGPVFCAGEGASASLTLAVKRGIVLALTRLAMQPTRNLSNMNWVIEPLGAVIKPRPNPEDLACLDENECTEFPQFTLCTAPDKKIDSAPSDGNCGFKPERIKASYDANCNTASEIYPGVAAAFCIIVSLLQLRGCCAPQAIIYDCNC